MMMSIPIIFTAFNENASQIQPQFDFNVFHIKTPQLFGIMFGCAVFIVTISAVIYLLYKSGSWNKFVEEMKSGQPLVFHDSSRNGSNPEVSALDSYPKLYDNLVEASKELPNILINVKWHSKNILIRNIILGATANGNTIATDGIRSDIEELFLASNGSGLYNESMYPPLRLWMWNSHTVVEGATSCSINESACRPIETQGMSMSTKIQGPKATESAALPDVPGVKEKLRYPCSSFSEFTDYILLGCCNGGCSPSDYQNINISGGGAASKSCIARSHHNSFASYQHLCIQDKEFGRPIGVITLANNNPRHLNVEIEYIWLTPAYQGRRVAHEAMLVLLHNLFEMGYRRIAAYVDARNVISKKFMERLGFKLECVLRKHRILQDRNSDSHVYVILNSEWTEIEAKLHHYVNIPVPKLQETHKIAEIPTTEEIVQDIAATRRRESQEGDGKEEGEVKIHTKPAPRRRNRGSSNMNGKRTMKS